MSANIADQVIENNGFKNFNVESMLIDGAIGAGLGYIGGSGYGNNHLSGMGRQFTKKVFNSFKYNGLISGLKTTAKATSYFWKSTISTTWKGVSNGILKPAAINIFPATVKEHLY